MLLSTRRVDHNTHIAGHKSRYGIYPPAGERRHIRGTLIYSRRVRAGPVSAKGGGHGDIARAARRRASGRWRGGSVALAFLEGLLLFLAGVAFEPVVPEAAFLAIRARVAA